VADARALGRYELVELLGQGGMGEVYLAKISGAAGFEKPCIVKTILPSLLTDSQFLDRFHHEAKVLVHLVHSNIAQVYDMGEADGTYFMALEYVAGVDLAHLEDQARASGKQLPLPVALFIAQKMVEGLGYAHRKTGPDGMPLNIVHRDVSPQNVMVSYEGEVKVIDFGLAKSAARSKHTMTPTVMGKLGYMSPEQARAEAVDHRSDIYSAGVVVWEMLAGRPLIPTGTMSEMMAAMMTPKVPTLVTQRADVDGGLDATVMRALALHPQERYARADDFARALGENLFRTGSSLGAEEVGNFVRTLCPDAFAAQRRLISKLTTVKGKSPAPSALRTPSPAAVPPGDFGLAATALRESGPLQTPPPGASQIIPGHRLNRGLMIGFVLFAVVASASATGWFVSHRDAVQERADLAAATRVQPTPVPPPATEPASPPPPAPAAAVAVAAPAPAPPTSEAKVEAAHHPKHHAPAGEMIPVGTAAEVFPDKGSHYARAGTQGGMSVGSEYPVVGSGGAKRHRVGTATVLEVMGPHLSRISLDDDAQAATGKRFLALNDSPGPPPVQAHSEEPSPPPPPAPTTTATATASPAAAPPLQGRASTAGFGPLRVISVFNSDKRTWQHCRALIRGRRVFAFDRLAPGGKRDIAIRDFDFDDEPRTESVPQHTVSVVCREGRADFFAGFNL
jgi:serine/threonine protein kinase